MYVKNKPRFKLGDIVKVWLEYENIFEIAEIVSMPNYSIRHPYYNVQVLVTIPNRRFCSLAYGARWLDNEGELFKGNVNTMKVLFGESKTEC